VVAYLGAARLVEPLRGEADQPDASAMGELAGSMYLLRWFATGPLVALAALLGPILVLQGAAGSPLPRAQAAVTNAASLLVTALAVQGAWLRSRHPPD
jgi:hypothetical protein